MKYLIVGRSGRGKDKLASELEKLGLKVLKSYATRPKRTPDEDTHIFITPEEATTITDRIATTTINGYEYFSTLKQVEECDVYIIDPNGLYELVKRLPETSFHIVHCITYNTDTCKEITIKRATNPEKEAEVFDARTAAEDEQFTKFEALLANKTLIADNCNAIHTYENDYEEQTAINYAKLLAGQKKIFNNLLEITNQCVSFGILSSSKPNHVDVTYHKPSKTNLHEYSFDIRSTPYEVFTDMVLADKDAFHTILEEWLASDIHIK